MSEFIDLIKGNSLNLIENSSALITKKLKNAYKSTMDQLSNEQSNNISKMFNEIDKSKSVNSRVFIIKRLYIVNKSLFI